MNRLAILAFVICTPSVTFAAEPAVRCVQNQLNALGFDAGVADGLFGQKTARAANAYLAEHGTDNASWKSNKLTQNSSRNWCAGLAKLHPEVAKFVPAKRISKLEGYVFEIGTNVSKSELRLVRRGILRAENYFRLRLNTPLSAAQKRKWKVKLVSTGKGNTERGGGGSCCTSMSGLHKIGPRLFLDVAHRDWKRRGSRKEITVAHEFTHGMQSAFGIKDFYGGPMARWMEEGMAEFYAWEMAIDERKYSRSRVEKNQLEWARGGRAINYPLTRFEPHGSSPHPGGIGHLALAGLVEISQHKQKAPIVYMESIKLLGREKAFETAFGITIQDFYRRFENWRKKALKRKTRVVVWSRM